MLRSRFPDTPLMVMIRPRTGDFLYDDGEIEVMLEDIKLFKNAGVRGVVFGMLGAGGRVDLSRTRRLVEEASPLEVCFHRAFDLTRDPFEAYDDISAVRGVTRILTSGHGLTVVTSIRTLGELLTRSQAKSGPQILPGSGINATTAAGVLSELRPLGLQGIHLSAGRWAEGGMLYHRDGLGMGAGGGHDWDVWRTDGEVAAEVRRILDHGL